MARRVAFAPIESFARLSQTPPAATAAATPADAAARDAYERAEALRIAGRCDEAIDAFGEIAIDQARSVWGGRAEMGVARCLIALGRPRDAMPHLQRVQRHAGELPAAEVEQALRWNTMLARRYLRSADEPLFVSGAPALSAATRLRDVIAMADVPASASASASVPAPASASTSASASESEAPAAGARVPAAATAGGAGRASAASGTMRVTPTTATATTTTAASRIALLTENAFLLYEADGRLTQSFTVQNPRGLLVDPAGGVRVVTRAGAQSGRAGEAPQIWRMPRGGSGAPQPLDDVSAACAMRNGDWLVSDRRTRGVHRFAAEGRFLGAFATGVTHRCAVSVTGDVALLDREAKAVNVFDGQGKPRYRLSARGEGYQLDTPVDLAFDAIGHLYVLDRGAATVWMFDAAGAPAGRVASPAAGDATFAEPTTMMLDAIGRLWIYDERLHRVVRWQ